MTDIATIQTRIATIDTLLAGGVKSASASDRRTDYDLEALKDERARLMRIVSSATSSSYRRVVFKNA